MNLYKVTFSHHAPKDGEQGIKALVTCRVRCSWEEISSLENGLYKDFGHMKLYTDKLSPKKVEKILNDYLAEHGR